MAIKSDNPPEIITLFQWAGINQSSPRNVIDDQELFWLENFFPIAPGKLRAGYGHSAAIYTAPAGTTILRIFFGRVNDTQGPVGLMFLSSGDVQQVQLNNGTVSDLGNIWSPVAPQYFADAKVWSPQQTGFTTGQPGGFVIGSPAGLYAWDGTTVTAPGAPAPAWLTSNTASTPNWPGTMPSANALPGIWALEVYQQRLWVMGKTVVSFSAAGNGADFATQDGGGTFPYFGDKLALARTDMAQGAGFLYLFNDSSIDVVANLQLVGQGTVFSPFTTAFQLSNVDPQDGQMFFRPVGHWGTAFTMYGAVGIYGFQAGTTQQAQLISQKIIKLYATLDPAPFQPTQCPCDIHGKRWMLFLGTFTDPFTIKRPLILCWDGQNFVAASQNLNLTQIASYEQNSSINAYGTDGNALYRLFAQPDPALMKRLSTKAYNGPNILTVKQWRRLYMEMHDELTPPGPEGVSLTGTMTTAGGNIPNGAEDIGFSVPPGAKDTVPQPVSGAGLSGSIDLQSLSPDFVLERLHLTYDERALFGA